MGLAAFAATSCEDAPGIAQPEVLPEPPAFTDGDVTIAVASDLSGTTTNLQSIAAADAPFNVATVQTVENLPAGASLNFGLQLSSTDDFANYVEVSAPVVDQTNAQANVLEVNGAIKQILGNVIDPVTVYYRIPGYAVIDNGIYRLGNSDKYYAAGSISVTPVSNPTVAVKPGEYLSAKAINLQELSDEGVETIDLATLTATAGMYEGYELSVKYLMSKSQDMSGASTVPVTYDAETGAITVATEDWITGQKSLYGSSDDECDVYWGIQAFYTYEGNTYNVSGDNNFAAKGDIKVTPLENIIPRHLGTPNDSQGWNSATSQWLLATDWDVRPSVSDVYTGYAYFGGTYGGKFTNDESGSEVWYGLDGTETIDPATGVVTGDLSTSGGNILQGSTAQLYWCDVNLGVEPGTFSLTPIKSYGIIGDATAGGWASETKMTPSDDYLIWTVETTLNDGSFKFRANDGWDINLGVPGDQDRTVYENLTQGGENLQTTITGDVTITLYLNAVPYRATVVAR